jgi:hypothetical protein
MTTVDTTRGGNRSHTRYEHTDSVVRRGLLACGVLSSLLYAAMLIFVPLRWPGYSSAAQAVSELSAIDSPTRSLWVPFGALYTVLVSAFGVGVLLAAGKQRALRVAGSVLVIYGILGLFWPPMHLRGTQPTLTDTLHVVFSVATVLLMLSAIALGAAALGKAFRAYSIATLAVFVLFGTLTFLQAPRIAANLPTPWLGVWERVNIGAFLVWVVVFATVLSRDGRQSDG